MEMRREVQKVRGYGAEVGETAAQIRLNLDLYPSIYGPDAKPEILKATRESLSSEIIIDTLKWLSERVKKPFVVFFDEVDCLAGDVLIAFLRQLRNGRISCTAPNSFSVSMALIGLRNIRDYKMFVRPQNQSTGEASPFKMWMAKVAAERLDQIQDPELSIQQALADYRRLGYSERWIARRLKSIDVRKDLTDEWKARGIEDEREYTSLTNTIYRTWAGMTAGEYKRFKGLRSPSRSRRGSREVL